jgi:hypothetical protein
MGRSGYGTKLGKLLLINNMETVLAVRLSCRNPFVDTLRQIVILAMRKFPKRSFASGWRIGIMTYASIDARTRELILDLVKEEALQPTEILTKLMAKQLTFNQIQDALAILLDKGIIEMHSDRRLHISQVAA